MQDGILRERGLLKRQHAKVQLQYKRPRTLNYVADATTYSGRATEIAAAFSYEVPGSVAVLPPKVSEPSREIPGDPGRYRVFRIGVK